MTTYSADNPIDRASDDQFDRGPFAARIAETIATRKDLSSLTVAIYGVWGDGKTSTLRMMVENLDQHEDIVAVEFNPWLFGNQHELIAGFFKTLCDAIRKSPHSALQKLGQKLSEYGGYLSIASGSVSTTALGVNIDPGQWLKSVGDKLSNVQLDDLKTQVEEAIKESGKRIVVLIDDIDRLDRLEIQALFKLVRLSAGFAGVTYVLAFDDEIVAASLGEKYAAGDAESGRAFLEKIIQVPLRLPPASWDTLRTYTFKGVEDALELAKIDISKEEGHNYASHFSQGFSAFLKTPRHS